MQLFDSDDEQNLFEAKPLPAKVRPENLEDFIGQDHAVMKGAVLRQLIENDVTASIILHGPPGSGKTTLALMAGNLPGRVFIALNAANDGVKEVKEAVEKAKHRLIVDGRKTLLFVDEIHRFNKSQQDSLLLGVENGWVSLMGATTENPSVSINQALLSRSRVIKLVPLNFKQLKTLILNALASVKGYNNEFTFEEEFLNELVNFSGSDARKTLTNLETIITMAKARNDKKLTIEIFNEFITNNDTVSFKDTSPSDTLSAFIKSIRGSDVDASLHYLTKMLNAGKPVEEISRRLIISASEDIGLADNNALNLAVNCDYAVKNVGMPEAVYFLTQATIYLSLAPKSNSVGVSYTKAENAFKQNFTSVPAHLKNIGHSFHPTYVSPHVSNDGVVKQNYLPENLLNDVYYEPKNIGFEIKLKERLLWLKNKLKNKR